VDGDAVVTHRLPLPEVVFEERAIPVARRLSATTTGGVDGDNARSFIDAGAVAVGVGGWLTSHEDRTLVTQRALALRDAVAL
jgi:2-keto-3-deoxy-6-phosphogluconate aldolase